MRRAHMASQHPVHSTLLGEHGKVVATWGYPNSCPGPGMPIPGKGRPSGTHCEFIGAWAQDTCRWNWPEEGPVCSCVVSRDDLGQQVQSPGQMASGGRTCWIHKHPHIFANNITAVQVQSAVPKHIAHLDKRQLSLGTLAQHRRFQHHRWCLRSAQNW